MAMQQQQQVANDPSSPELAKFCALPSWAQAALTGYPELVLRVLESYAGESGVSAESAVRALLDGCPELLAAVDNQFYWESPLGRAMLCRRLDACWTFVRLAERHGTSQRVLRHRNSSGHTLLMLAVDFDSQEAATLLELLLDEWPEQVHTCYDTEGRNVFHHCAADRRAVSLFALLHRLAVAHPAVAQSVARVALHVPDGAAESPIHHMAASGQTDALRFVADFLRRLGWPGREVREAFGRRWPRRLGRSPLDAATAAGAQEARDWLLENGTEEPVGKGEGEGEEDDDGEDEAEEEAAAAAVEDLGRLSFAS